MSRDTVIQERCFFPAGGLVFAKGDEATCAYLVQSGSVRVYTDDNGKQLDLAHLGMGQIFGELALMFDEPRSANVEAAEDTQLIRITREIFRSKMDRSDPTVQAIIKMLTQRIVATNDTLLKNKKGLADLIDINRDIYQNVLNSLPEEKQPDFKASVLPSLDTFLESVRAFKQDN